MKLNKLLIFPIFVITILSCSKQSEISNLSGDYLDGEPPGKTAKLLDHAIISTAINEDASQSLLCSGTKILGALTALYSQPSFINELKSGI